ncbi:unnamed protein product [Symbiodinium sp. CCMP2592]|nr:unnamed protein product [Symbiodinium sp. CCMP2592]
MGLAMRVLDRNVWNSTKAFAEALNIWDDQSSERLTTCGGGSTRNGRRTTSDAVGAAEASPKGWQVCTRGVPPGPPEMRKGTEPVVVPQIVGDSHVLEQWIHPDEADEVEANFADANEKTPIVAVATSEMKSDLRSPTPCRSKFFESFGRSRALRRKCLYRRAQRFSQGRQESQEAPSPTFPSLALGDKKTDAVILPTIPPASEQ